MRKRILILTGDMAETLEVMYPLHRLREEGYQVDIAAPHKKTLQTVVHDFEPGFETFTEKFGHRVEADIDFADVQPEAYDGAVIPGGRAPEHIRNHPEFPGIIGHFVEAGKPIAFECHAIQALLPLGLIKGRTCTAFWALESDIRAAGGTFVDREVVVDGNFVTSRAWIDHPAFMREFIKLLKEAR